MLTVHGLDEFPEGGPGSALALGTFDGLHLGHQTVIGEAVARARGGLRSVVVTFEPHPLEVLRPSPEPVLLTTLDERLPLLARLGVDLTVVLRFDLAFSQTPAEVWLNEVLGRRFGARAVYAGSSYTFSGDSLDVVSASVPTTETAACWIAVTPNGKFAYAGNAGSASVTGYQVAPDGTTTLIGRTWYTLQVRPAFYFDWWTHDIFRAVHLRVMKHIQQLSEQEG